MKRRFRAVIFDFDYTLADSSRGVIECINFALDELGLPRASAEAARRTIGLSLPDTFLELVGPQHAAQSDEFAHLFIKRADAASFGSGAAETREMNALGHSSVMSDLTVLFKSVPEVIEKLRSQGFSLGIVSTKFRYRIESVLMREGLLDAFDVIIGGEDVAKHKPDPTGLLRAIERLGSVPASTLYLGDSVTDAQTAERAGVPFVAVLSGVTPREAFGNYSVCKVLASLSDLPNWEGWQWTRGPSST